MANAWEPERVVDERLASALVSAQFPELAGAAIAPFGAGFDNTAYLVAGAWVIRFPRRAIAVPLLEAETRILSEIAYKLPLKVPFPELVGHPTDAYPWPFAGYRCLPGRTACSARLDERARLALASQLGAFLRALHALPLADVLPLAPPDDTLRRMDVAYRKGRAQETLARLVARGLVDAELVRAFETVVAETPDAAADPRTLVHGDLYVRHLLVGDDGAPTGVIDWGDVHLGHPAVDLALGFSFFPREARGVFFEAYGSVSAELGALARFRALYHTASVLEFAQAIADADLEREARLGLAWAVAG